MKLQQEFPVAYSGNILDCSIFAWPVQAWKGANYSDRVLLAGLCVAVFGAALFLLEASPVVRRRGTEVVVQRIHLGGRFIVAGNEHFSMCFDEECPPGR